MDAYDVLDVMDPRTDIELARDALVMDVSNLITDVATLYMRPSEAWEWHEYLEDAVRDALMDVRKAKS